MAEDEDTQTGSSELCFPHKGKKPGEREGKKNPYTTVLHYWVGQNPTNREELEEEGGGESGEDSTQTEAACSGPGVRLDTPGS